MQRSNLTIIDSQMRPHARRLEEKVGIQPTQARSLATTIFGEISASDANLREAIRNSSPVSVKRRLLFFEDYQVWDTVIRAASHCPSNPAPPPQIVRRSYVEMQWVIHLYCSFIFAGDSLFEVLKKKGPAGSCTRKCTAFIRENPIRALRHAVAHGNWQLQTETSVDYWARKGESMDAALTQYQATYDDLKFYLDLTRCTAWASFLAVVAAMGEGHEDLHGFYPVSTDGLIKA